MAAIRVEKSHSAEVQNKELWKMYLEEAEKHETEFRFCASMIIRDC